jgi:hypothetical protein
MILSAAPFVGQAVTYASRRGNGSSGTCTSTTKAVLAVFGAFTAMRPNIELPDPRPQAQIGAALFKLTRFREFSVLIERPTVDLLLPPVWLVAGELDAVLLIAPDWGKRSVIVSWSV